MPKKSKFILKYFSAFKYRNYRLFWIGECISLIGTWMQSIALSWLVIELTHSAYKLALISVFQFLPMMLFSVFAGALVDRFHKVNILILTQLSMIILSFILAMLTHSGLVEFWHLIFLALLIGIVNTIDVPARQSFFIELVGKKDFMNAVALNSGIFNLSRIAGPALGGIIISLFGTTVCFYVNSISYIPVVICLLMIRSSINLVSENKTVELQNIFLEIKQGLQYIKNRDIIKFPLLLLLFLSIFTMNFNIMIPIYAQQSINQNAMGYGFLMTSMAIGSFAGSIFLTAKSSLGPKYQYLYVASFGMSIFLIFLGTDNNYFLACLIIFFIGLSAMILATMVNSFVQIYSNDYIRGRVASVYSLVLGGVTPIGAFYAGKLIEYTSVEFCMITSGIIGIISTSYIILRHKKAFIGKSTSNKY